MITKNEAIIIDMLLSGDLRIGPQRNQIKAAISVIESISHEITGEVNMGMVHLKPSGSVYSPDNNQATLNLLYDKLGRK